MDNSFMKFSIQPVAKSMQVTAIRLRKTYSFLRFLLSFPCFLLSFPRRRESIKTIVLSEEWIPAFAGMTAFKQLFLNLIVVFWLFFFSSLSFAKDTSSLYQFDSSAQQQQFQELTEQLRCLVCQNESLWDSNAGLAKDLRMEVYNKIKQGYTNAQIKKYLVDRYGQFILFKPAFNPTTYLLWIIPFALLVIGFFIVVVFTRSSKQRL